MRAAVRQTRTQKRLVRRSKAKASEGFNCQYPPETRIRHKQVNHRVSFYELSDIKLNVNSTFQKVSIWTLGGMVQ